MASHLPGAALIMQAALNLALAVALGAFGAHGLKAKVPDSHLEWWHTATAYFFYHALGLLLIGILSIVLRTSITLPFWLIQLGIILFCGSLYMMTLGAPRWFGAITPLGGLSMIAGWLLLAWTISKMHLTQMS